MVLCFVIVVGFGSARIKVIVGLDILNKSRRTRKKE